MIPRYNSIEQTFSCDLHIFANARENYFRFRSVLGIALNKDEFVECGGHRTVSAKLSDHFYRQIVHACRDTTLPRIYQLDDFE